MLSNCLQASKKVVHYYRKVDIVREVLRLGKGVNERAHLPCGAMFGPLQKRFFLVTSAEKSHLLIVILRTAFAKLQRAVFL